MDDGSRHGEASEAAASKVPDMDVPSSVGVAGGGNAGLADVHSAVGTVHYMAPEVIRDHKYTKTVDWWACGVTFYECIVGCHLFQGNEKRDIMEHILMGPIDTSALRRQSESLDNLVSGLLIRDYMTRLGANGASKIKHHEFFAGTNFKSVSTTEPRFKPAQSAIQRCNDKHKSYFYGKGPRDGRFSTADAASMSTESGRRRGGKKKVQMPSGAFREFINKSEVRREWITSESANVASVANAGSVTNAGSMTVATTPINAGTGQSAPSSSSAAGAAAGSSAKAKRGFDLVAQSGLATSRASSSTIATAAGAGASNGAVSSVAPSASVKQLLCIEEFDSC